MSDQNHNCGNCFYWRYRYKLPNQAIKSGECRRNPPTVTGFMAEGAVSQWPDTFEDDWCGEYIQAAFPPERIK